MSARQPTSAMTRLSGAVVAGLAVGVAVGTWKTWPIGVLTGIAAGGGLFVISGWLTLWPRDADATYRQSDREDFRPRLEEMAAELGSDVPYFIRGGTAAATGRGERPHAPASDAIATLGKQKFVCPA